MRSILWFMTWMHWWAMWKVADLSATYANPIFLVGMALCMFFDVCHWLMKLEAFNKGKYIS